MAHLVRAFAAEGHPLDVGSRIRACLATGGPFRRAKSIAKLISEMKKGVTHCVAQRHVPNRVQVLRDRVSSEVDLEI